MVWLDPDFMGDESLVERRDPHGPQHGPGHQRLCSDAGGGTSCGTRRGLPVSSHSSVGGGGQPKPGGGRHLPNA